MTTATQTNNVNLEKCVQLLKDFIPEAELRTIWHHAKNKAGEESQHFADLIEEICNRIENMPHTYQTDGQGNNAIVYLHYFRGGADWYITEKDIGCPDETKQIQAYGVTDLGHGPEMGYINIAELIRYGVELDLYWEPKPLGEIIGYK